MANQDVARAGTAAFAALAALLLGAAPGRAEAMDGGPALGLRLGYAVPTGSAVEGDALRNTLSGVVPLRLDAGWRFDEPWYAGAYVQVGRGLVAGRLRGAVDGASALDLHVGVEGRHRFDPVGPLAPWFGVGVGYEWQRLSLTTPQGSGRLILSGAEASLVVGGEAALPGGHFTVGPFVGIAAGQYFTVGASGGGLTTTTAVRQRAAHLWWSLGVAGSFAL